jgi:sortase B
MSKKRKTLVILSILLLVYSLWGIAGGLLEDSRSEVRRGALPSLAPGGKSMPAPLSAPPSHHTAEEQEPAIRPEYRELYAQNPDMVGWVSIEGTNVDYPVMQRGQDEEYYLDHDFEGKKNKNGLPFLDGGCDAQESNILLVYGHHMKNGRMFGGLMEYKDEGFYNAHPTVRFETLYEAAEFEIVAVLRSRIYLQTEEEFRYYRLAGTETPDGFERYLQSVKERALYDTGVSARYGDQLLVLSTCEYSTENGRLAIVARKVG